MEGHVIAQPQLFTRTLKVQSKGSGVGQHGHVVHQIYAWLTGSLDPLQSGVTDDQGAKRVKRHHRRPRAQSDGGQTIKVGTKEHLSPQPRLVRKVKRPFFSFG